MNIDKTLAILIESVEQAIKSGDWKVDGRNDPELIMFQAEAELRRNGWTRNGIGGGFMHEAQP